MTADVPDYFSLFGLPRRFGIDPEALRRSYDQVMDLVHPDRHVQSAASQRRAAMQMASLANQAWQTLQSDVARAAYLCQLGGVVMDGPGAAKVPPGVLEQQWAWREALEEARERADHAVLARLGAAIETERQLVLERLTALFDKDDNLQGAAEQTRILMFLDKFRSEWKAASEHVAPAASLDPGAA